MRRLDIRPATQADLDALVRLGGDMRAESPTPFPPPDRDAVAGHLALVAARPDRLFAAVARRGADPVGFVCGAVGPWPFSPETRAGCELLYVAPAYRGTPAGVCLLRAFIDWADRRGAASVVLGLSTGIAPERTARLLRKLGFAPLGETFRLLLED